MNTASIGMSNLHTCDFFRNSILNVPIYVTDGLTLGLPFHFVQGAHVWSRRGTVPIKPSECQYTSVVPTPAGLLHSKVLQHG